ncbi:conjugal transfer protein TraD [Sphingomonas psychrotolerans]|uniref:Conjugal transfer protein TraD n=1 Tax=Sphingomonas psychrotolerans TaxID=1327635 RepID=A0A2K8MAP2_9SPHN|nr:conjugal transfer protein TraD [Sphingomonas psychrotolerans]ATY30952.1 conjugal transfer protein TraD [Sphingomonas psychrotolerans]
MRKPRDFDAELKVLNDKARQLKDHKLRQLGELVIATDADALPIEQLAGLLLAGVENKDSSAKESWRKRGATFFQRTARLGGSAGERSGGVASGSGSAQSS